MRKRLWFDTETGDLYRKDVSEVYHDVDGKLSDLTNDETMKVFEEEVENPFISRDIIELKIDCIEDNFLRQTLLELYHENKEDEDSSFIEDAYMDVITKEIIIVLKGRWKLEMKFPPTLQILKAFQSDLGLVEYFIEMGL